MDLGGRYFTDQELKKVGFKNIGLDVKIHSRASIYGVENISIGNHVRIDDYAVIIATGFLEIGNFVSIHNFCYLASKFGILLSDYVTLAPGVMIFSASDDYSGMKLTGPVVPKVDSGGKSGKVILNKHVIIGARSVILPDCLLDEGVAVGALSLVKTNLLPWTIYAGIPVKKIKKRKQILLNLVHEEKEL